jgi:hypothetical protein
VGGLNPIQEPSPKRSKQRLRNLRGDRERRIRLLILRGLISDASAIPEDSIPIDPDCSVLADHRSPACFYQDFEFKCSDCKRTEVWISESQQYYFEIMRSSA